MDASCASRTRLKTLWRLSWPAIIEQVLVTMVSYADTAMVGVLGAAGTAAVSVNAAPIWLGNGLMTGVGIGYSVQVSNAIGAGDEARARQVIRQGVLAALVVGLVGLAIYQLLAGLFNSDPQVVAQAALMLRIVAFCEPFFALSIIFSGTLRGAHDVRIPMVVGPVCMWGVRVILALTLVYKLRVGLAGVWLAMDADLILRGILCTLRWRSGRWARKCGLA